MVLLVLPVVMDQVERLLPGPPPGRPSPRVVALAAVAVKVKSHHLPWFDIRSANPIPRLFAGGFFVILG